MENIAFISNKKKEKKKNAVKYICLHLTVIEC